MINGDIIKVLRAAISAGQKVVYIYDGSGIEFYFCYTSFEFVDNSANKLDVKGKDITELIQKNTLTFNVNNDAQFKDQLYTVLGGLKDIRIEFSHQWKWVNFVALY